MHGHAAHSKVHHHLYHVTPAGVAGTGSAGVIQGLDGLDGAFRQYGGNGVLLHVNFGAFRDLDGQEFVAHFSDTTHQTAANDDLIAFVQVADQLLVLLSTLAGATTGSRKSARSRPA